MCFEDSLRNSYFQLNVLQILFSVNLCGGFDQVLLRSASVGLTLRVLQVYMLNVSSMLT